MSKVEERLWVILDINNLEPPGAHIHVYPSPHTNTDTLEKIAHEAL